MRRKQGSKCSIGADNRREELQVRRENDLNKITGRRNVEKTISDEKRYTVESASYDIQEKQHKANQYYYL